MSADYRIFYHGEPFFDINLSSSSTNVIKLNGSVDRLHDGVIFSTDEYVEAMQKATWYDTLAADYLSGTTMVFLGTKLKEPLYNYHLSRLMALTDSAPGQSYVVCPQIGEITAENFRAKNILPFRATANDFVAFVRSSLGGSYTKQNITKERLPSFVSMLQNMGVQEADSIILGLYDIVPVKRDNLGQLQSRKRGLLKEFYSGNSPTWLDIVEGVHAELDVFAKVRQQMDSSARLIVVHGSAGCGKSTCIYDTALYYAQRYHDKKVYFVKPSASAGFPLRSLRFIASQVDGDLIFVVDDFVQYSRSIAELCSDNLAKNVRFLVASRTNAWARAEGEFADVAKAVIPMRWITRDDATRILEKLKTHGDWSRLEKLSDKQRLEAIFHSPKRQLLVALKEATTGRGFDDIIRANF